jgi:hypothetical protein
MATPTSIGGRASPAAGVNGKPTAAGAKQPASTTVSYRTTLLSETVAVRTDRSLSGGQTAGPMPTDSDQFDDRKRSAPFVGYQSDDRKQAAGRSADASGPSATYVKRAPTVWKSTRRPRPVQNDSKRAAGAQSAAATSSVPEPPPFSEEIAQDDADMRTFLRRTESSSADHRTGGAEEGLTPVQLFERRQLLHQLEKLAKLSDLSVQLLYLASSAPFGPGQEVDDLPGKCCATPEYGGGCGLPKKLECFARCNGPRPPPFNVPSARDYSTICADCQSGKGSKDVLEKIISAEIQRIRQAKPAAAETSAAVGLWRTQKGLCYLCRHPMYGMNRNAEKFLPKIQPDRPIGRRSAAWNACLFEVPSVPRLADLNGDGNRQWIHSGCRSNADLADPSAAVSALLDKATYDGPVDGEVLNLAERRAARAAIQAFGACCAIVRPRPPLTPEWTKGWTDVLELRAEVRKQVRDLIGKKDKDMAAVLERALAVGYRAVDARTKKLIDVDWPEPAENETAEPDEFGAAADEGQVDALTTFDDQRRPMLAADRRPSVSVASTAADQSRSRSRSRTSADSSLPRESRNRSASPSSSSSRRSESTTADERSGGGIAGRSTTPMRSVTPMADDPNGRFNNAANRRPPPPMQSTYRLPNLTFLPVVPMQSQTAPQTDADPPSERQTLPPLPPRRTIYPKSRYDFKAPIAGGGGNRRR